MGVQEQNGDTPVQRTEEAHTKPSESQGRGPDQSTISTMEQWKVQFSGLNEYVAGMFLTQDKVFKLINEKLAHMFGRKMETLIDKAGLEDLAFHEDRGLVEENLQKLLCAADDTLTFEFRGVTQNGDIIHVEAHGQSMTYEGRPAVVGTVLDITDRVRGKRLLEKELKKFQALYDLAVAMTAEHTLDENLLLVVNKARELLEVDKAFVALADETGDLYMHTLAGIVTEDFRTLRIPVGVGLGGKVSETGRWCVVEDYFKEVGPAFHDVVRAEGLLSGIAVPVNIGQKNLGVLYAFNREKTPFSKSDLDTLSLLGYLSAVEITRKRAEEGLRQGETNYKKLYEDSKRRAEIYESLLNSSADAIVIYDMDGFAQYVNPSFTRIFGWTLQEVVGRRVPFLPDSERETSMEIIYGLIKDGTPCSAFETKRYTKDGRVLDISISASRCHDHEGKPVGLLVILRNITDRKAAEAALKESEERFRTLADVAPFAIGVAAADETAEYVNPKFTEIFGYVLQDVPNLETWFLKAYPDEEYRGTAEAAWRKEKQHIRDGRVHGGEAKPRVFKVRCKDGTDKIISFRGVLLPDGRTVVTYLDITAEAKAQEEIVRAKNEWERTFNAVSDLIILMDVQQRIVRANDAAARRFGVTPEQIIGMNCSERLASGKTPALFCLDTGTPTDGVERSAEVFDESLEGVFDLRVSPLRDEMGRVYGSVHVARDITAFKSMERARRLAVHHLAHELKTPLAVIKGSLKDLDSESTSTASRTAKLDRIKRNLDRLADIQQIVNEIVAPRTYHPRRFKLGEAVQGILKRCREKSAHRSVSIKTDVVPAETDVLDPDVFEQVLGTLVKNAIENTPDEGEITVSVFGTESGYLLKVRDEGVGITSSDREFLFEAFHHTQDTELYSTRSPFDFDAGGKGLELLRLKIMAQEGYFSISFESSRCRHIPRNTDVCAGRISLCPHISCPEECHQSGGTTFTVLFTPPKTAAAKL